MLFHGFVFIFFIVIMFFGFTGNSFRLARSTMQAEMQSLNSSKTELASSKSYIYNSALENLEMKE